MVAIEALRPSPEPPLPEVTSQRLTLAMNDQNAGSPRETQDVEGEQLELPLPLADHHPYPWVSMGRDERGRWTGTYRRPADLAWCEYVHVEHNAPNGANGVYLDVDGAAETFWATDAGTIPDPTVLMVRTSGPHAGHEAAAWLLDSPVHRNETSRRKPQQLLARVSEYFASVLSADASYAGSLFRNVGVARNDPRFHVIESGRTYGLVELAEYIPRRWRRPRPSALRTPAGRNDYLFLALIRLAGREGGRASDIEIAAWTINREFVRPLPDAEVLKTVRSVLRYRERWERRGWHNERFILRQAARGRLSGKARARKAARAAQAALALRAEGLTQREIAGELGCTTRTVRGYLSATGNEPTHDR